MTEIDHEKRNRLIKSRTPKKVSKTSVAGAPVPGEREKDLARLQELKHKRHPTKRSTPRGQRSARQRRPKK